MNALVTKEIRPQELVSLVQEHLNEFDGLVTFGDVRAWDELATRHTHQLTQMCKQLLEQANSLTGQRNRADMAHRGQPFFRRMFIASPVQEIQKQINSLQAFLDDSGRVLDILQAKIDFSPNDPASKKAALSELRQRKKELQLEKRQVGLEMRAIRTEARQLSTNAPYSTSSFFGGRKVTAMQRQAIRHAKEQAIAPHEQEKASIEWELTEIDRMILWVEKIC